MCLFLVEDDESLPERYEPLADVGDAASDDDEAKPIFDDEEDAKLILKSKQKFLKSKGIKVNKPRVVVPEVTKTV